MLRIVRDCRSLSRVALVAAALAAAPAVHAELSAEEIAKLAQNPVANLISVPFQNNANLNYGPRKQTQDILNIQPVIPIDLSPDWNLITRTIVPLISQPAVVPGESRTYGVGATQLSAFLSPANAKGIIWGVGSIVQIPTATQPELGPNRWGVGPTAVVLRLEHGNPWVYGALANNVWSVGNGTGGSYNNFLIQPFVNYNFKDGTYLTSAPIATANWEAQKSKDTWTVPIGGGIGHIYHIGKLPLNTQVSGYYNIVTPTYGPNWQIRLQAQVMFPK